MAAALDLHPAPGHPAAVVAAVHEVLDHVDVTGLAAGLDRLDQRKAAGSSRCARGGRISDAGA